MLKDNPQARRALYLVAFVASALALFAPMLPGDLGVGLTTAFNGLATLAAGTAAGVAIKNIPSSEE